MMLGARPSAPQSLGFRLEAWAAWLPGAESLAWGGVAAAEAALPAGLRRRVTPIGRKVLEAAWRLVVERPGDQSRIVLSSRHGEYARTIGLLRSLAESGEVSPAEFSLAVHHGLAGLLSIAAGNRAGHTAVAAGPESFGYGCLEAAACLAEGAPGVLLLHFDEPLPEDYAAVCEREESGGLALALLLRPDRGEGERIALSLQPAASPGSGNPGLAFVRLLEGRDAEAVARSERQTWTWRRVG